MIISNGIFNNVQELTTKNIFQSYLIYEQVWEIFIMFEIITGVNYREN